VAEVQQQLHPTTKKERKPAMSEQTPLTKADLHQFTGSEHWYRHGLNRNVVFTDGAKYVADHGGAYWLLDAIAITQRYEKAVAAADFQVWKLTVKPDHSGTLVCEDGNGHVIYTQPLEFTDFPLPEITLWFADNTIFLPSEY
jgi:hypothetical protein